MSTNTLAIYGLAAAAACALTYSAVTYHKISCNYTKLDAFIENLQDGALFTLSGDKIENKTGTCDFFQQNGRHCVTFKADRYSLDLGHLLISVNEDNEKEIIGEDFGGKKYKLVPKTFSMGGKRRRRSRAWR